MALVADLADGGPGGGPLGGCGGTAEAPGGEADGALRGLPGGRASATDMSAAMGDGPPGPGAGPALGGETAARPRGEPACPLVSADADPTYPEDRGEPRESEVNLSESGGARTPHRSA